MSRIHHGYFSGLSGIELPVPKYKYPPAYQNASRLTYYSTFFNSIEINSSFYKIPQKSTVTRWIASVPNDFRFTFKLLRDVTHSKDLNFRAADIANFMEVISEAGTKKGAILIQFPPGLSSANIPQLDTLLKILQSNNLDRTWDVAVEFRNKEWYHDEVFEILENRSCGLVIHDKPACATPARDIGSPFIYLRFHGPTGNYRGSYTEAYLQEYAESVREWWSAGKRVYVYFNNTAGDAFANLETFNRMV